MLGEVKCMMSKVMREFVGYATYMRSNFISFLKSFCIVTIIFLTATILDRNKISSDFICRNITSGEVKNIPADLFPGTNSLEARNFTGMSDQVIWECNKK